MGPLMIRKAYTPMYIGEVWDVTPVHTQKNRQLESRAVSAWAESVKKWRVAWSKNIHIAISIQILLITCRAAHNWTKLPSLIWVSCVAPGIKLSKLIPFSHFVQLVPFCSTGTNPPVWEWHWNSAFLHCFICFQILPGSLGIAARVAAVVPLAGQICVLVRMGDSVPPRLTINVILLLYPSPPLCNISLLSGWQI